jgi:alpha-D-xyloside xylohydrolase
MVQAKEAAEAGQDAVRSIAPGVWQLHLGSPEKITPVALRDEPVQIESLKTLPPVEQPPLDLGRIALKVTPRGCLVKLPMASGENVFGFGLDFKVFNATGKRRVLRVSDLQIVNDQGDTHAPVPFYVSTRGYGVFVDTARCATFWCGNLAEAAGAKQMTIEVPAARGVDLYVFAGPDMRTAVQRYNLFSGGGCLPPLWGLGVWYRGDVRFNAQDSLALAREFRKSHIPCDVYGLEPGWQSQAYSCSFVWSPTRFPDPAGFGREMSGLGYHLNLWEHAYTHPSSPIHAALRPYSGDYLVWKGLVPDFSLAPARQIYAEHHDREFVQRAGVSGFKLDECDDQPLSPSPWSFPDCAQFPSGADGEQMHRLFGTLYQHTIAGIYKKHGLRTYGQVRASGALAAPEPFVIYSDYYDHKDYVRALVNSGFSGLLWQPEVRDSASVEELYRRTQTAVFSPQTLINAWYIKLPPWKQTVRAKNNAGELMPDWKVVESEIRKLFELRMSLVPYLYSSFAQYRQRGMPPFRALVMDWPDDPRTYKVDDQYMMGDSLLVAPLFAGSSRRDVYLPAGRWYDFWTHEPYEGHRTYSIEKPPVQIPVFVKAGTLLPLARPLESIPDKARFAITVTAFGTECRPAELYEDDGLSCDYEKGLQNVLTLTWSPEKGGHVTKSGNYSGSRYDIDGWQPLSPPPGSHQPQSAKD